MKARDPNNTVKATNSLFDLLKTSNDLPRPLMTFKLKMLELWLSAYQTKARNPGNTVASTNSVFDLLMISNNL